MLNLYAAVIVILYGCVDLPAFSSSPKPDVVETATSIDAMDEPLRNRYLVCFRISALSTSDIDAVVQDLDNLCAEVVYTHTMDAIKYGEVISSLTDHQVLYS